MQAMDEVDLVVDHEVQNMEDEDQAEHDMEDNVDNLVEHLEKDVEQPVQNIEGGVEHIDDDVVNLDSDTEKEADDLHTANDPDETLRRKLAEWAANRNVSHATLSELLSILLGHGLDVPKDPRTLLGTLKDCEVKNIGQGNYYHFGLANAIISELKMANEQELTTDKLTIRVNVDGLPLSRSSNMQLWPILEFEEMLKDGRKTVDIISRGLSEKLQQQQEAEEEDEGEGEESEEEDEEERGDEDEDSDMVPPSPPDIRSPAHPTQPSQGRSCPQRPLGGGPSTMSSPQLPQSGRPSPLSSPQLQRRETQATHVEATNHQIYTKILTLMEEIKDTQRVHSQMLQTLLKKDKGAQLETPEGVEFPLKNEEDVQQLEAKLADADLMSAVVHMVADIGGTSVDDATRRMMRFVFSNELALIYNLTGKHGKNKFKDLHLFKVIHEALKKNPLTSNTNQQEAERALGKWFTGARDRGGLRAARVLTALDQCAVDRSNSQGWIGVCECISAEVCGVFVGMCDQGRAEGS
ncbi:hypothetical protein N1851_022202 [Merluccius polli]|uniref:DUF4806 domain-containing protein n=1 Tax=Merluccius polli TaxID=89951 RepID=A0AA47MIN2_MERPO|nr:hypothetical protein N1851_022202 [Merluccius polli]